MYRIRQIKYSSNSISIQVYKIVNRKRIIVKHIGTSHNDKERFDLLLIAKDYIEKMSNQINLFENGLSNNILHINQIEYIGVYYSFLYELISKLLRIIGLERIRNQLLLDFVLLRIIEPASKLRSIELLDEYFGIKHRRQNYYQSASEWLRLKSKVESIVLRFARVHYNFDFELLFYDVTTLYFESFSEDELRKKGFSKDNKSQQPQILVALMVSKEGFPITYEVFAGNTFEGHTIIPVVKKFINKNKVKNLTVIADAAMISSDNILELKANRINYIVGARLGNLSNDIIDKIDKKMPRKDGKTIRVKTDNGYLICSYSLARYQKSNYEMEKQIEKAKLIIDNPSKNKKLKFLKSCEKKLELNEKLIDKTKILLGIKGYYTNLDKTEVDDHTIIERYNELYRIEQAFRMSKTDLQTRPIFHYKEDPIKLHLLICFMALVVSRHIELKTNTSIKYFIHECKKITDARLRNKTTDKEFFIRVKSNHIINDFLLKLGPLT